MTAPLLVIAVGNPARGDDGLGPALLDMLAAQALAGVELLPDFQLQVEHALDLVGRQAVLFIDASKAAVGVALSPVTPAQALPALSHALTPAGVLHVAQRLGQALPCAWQLAIEGEAFALGEGLSAAAQRRLPGARMVALQWLASHRGGLVQDAPQPPASGSSTANTAPPPGRLPAVSCPPCCSTMP